MNVFCCIYYLKVKDDRIILDKSLADQVSIWKNSRGLTDKVVADHACSGETCSYYKIGDVFVCEKTGNVHGRNFPLPSMSYLSLFGNWIMILSYFVSLFFTVCDDTCREVIMDPANELLVCTISGRCFDRLLSPSEIEPDLVSKNFHQFSFAYLQVFSSI